jgi:FkbM family methyltransferase
MSGDTANDLDQLLNESPEQARRREGCAFDDLIGGSDDNIVLFGAGNLGRRTLAGLRKLGFNPRCFVDSSPSRWGHHIEGLPVFSPEEGAKLFGDSCVFVVTIWGALGKDRMAMRVGLLQRLGCARVSTFVPLYWKFPELFLPHYTIGLPHHVIEQGERVRSAFQLMSDDESCMEYVSQLRFRLFGDFECLRNPVPGPIYFPQSLFSLESSDVFVDCGAFDGDTLEIFLAESNGFFESAFAFEPDPENFARLFSKVSLLPEDIRTRIRTYELATGDANMKLNMEIGVGPSSQVGKGDYQIESRTLDSVLAGVPASIIKMDIEGAEFAALTGAKELIGRHNPVLAVSAYHRQSDLWNLPLLIHELNPSYSIHLRPHMLEGWDLVCYAIPPHRLVNADRDFR